MSARMIALPLLLACIVPAQGQLVPVEPPPPRRAPLLLAAATDAPGFEVRLGRVPVRGELFVRDGDTGRELALPTRAGSDLMVFWSARPYGRWLFGHAQVTNRREAQVKLEVGLRAQVFLDAPRFFDGFRVQDADRERVNDRFTGIFPLTTLSDDAACLALGYLPDQWFSYLRHRSAPGEGGVVLETATRIVVDAGAAETVSFVIGGFEAGWGHLEALHWYYDAFSAFFRPRADVDPRVSGNGGSYLAWTGNPDPELCRRLQVGWEWCYAPFKRTGDIYGRPEFWDYTPARPHDRTRQLPLEEYHQWRRDRFEAGRLCDVAMMCYIPSQVWCEEQLAREHYPDALITDERAKTFFDTPWVTGPDNELRMFPYMTSFGRQSLIDMEALVRENNIQGFAFDTANGGAKYFGPAVNESPGRAWDDRGVYVDEGVAIAKLMDWCHEHRDAAGRTLAVVSNPGAMTCYLTPFRSDSAMIEADPTTVHSGSAVGFRNFLGHKTMVFWENYDLETLLDYEALTAEQMTDALEGLADYTIIASLRLAAVPTPRVTLGNRKLAGWMPLLTEIARAGWQPVPAATTDTGLPMSRAGEGLRQFIMTGNEAGEEVAGTVQVQNAWLAPGAMLFVAEGGAATANEVTGGRTAVRFSLPSRGALVLRSAATFDPAPEGLQASVGLTEDLHAARLRVSLTCAEPREAVLRLPDWGRWTPDRVTLDGREIAMTPIPEGWISTAPVQLSGRQALEVAWASVIFRASNRRLEEFPWVRDGAPGFEIVTGPAPDPGIADMARWIADYFPYYYRHAVEPPLEVAPPDIVPTATRTVEQTVTLVVDPGAPRRVVVTTAGGGREMRIAGHTPQDVREGAFALLAALDRTHPYGGRLTGTPAIRATGLAGREIGR